MGLVYNAVPVHLHGLILSYLLEEGWRLGHLPLGSLLGSSNLVICCLYDTGGFGLDC